MTQLTVKRIHNDEVQTLPLGSAVSTTECYFIDNTSLVLRVQQFSTYAAAGPGTTTTNPANADAGAGGIGDDVPMTGDASMPMLWAGLALVSGAGLAVCARRRRRNG